MMVAMYVGIDGGGTLLYAVAIDADLNIIDATTFPADATDGLLAWSASAREIAIDAPATLSSAPHRDDQTLSGKFRTARCAEIQLGREIRIWVPRATPTEASKLEPWMRVGIELFARLIKRGKLPIEVFPFAGFRVLADMRRLPKKGTASGVAARAQLLQVAGVRQPLLAMWSHDAIDALLAAVIAHRKAHGRARPISCGHDGSAIWIP